MRIADDIIQGIMIPAKAAHNLSLQIKGLWPAHAVPACRRDYRYTHTERLLEPSVYAELIERCNQCPALDLCAEQLGDRWEPGWAVMAGRIHPRLAARLDNMIS